MVDMSLLQGGLKAMSGQKLGTTPHSCTYLLPFAAVFDHHQASFLLPSVFRWAAQRQLTYRQTSSMVTTVMAIPSTGQAVQSAMLSSHQTLPGQEEFIWMQRRSGPSDSQVEQCSDNFCTVHLLILSHLYYTVTSRLKPNSAANCCHMMDVMYFDIQYIHQQWKEMNNETNHCVTDLPDSASCLTTATPLVFSNLSAQNVLLTNTLVHCKVS